MQADSIIFDLDGTLLNTLEDIVQSSNEVLRLMGYPAHPKEKYPHFIGGGLKNLMGQIIPKDVDRAVIPKCCDHFNAIYQKNWKRNCYPYQGINDMLAALTAKGIKTAVLSNKPHAFTISFVDEYFKKGQFEVVYGQRSGVAKKPHPQVPLEIAKILRTSPGRCLFVGDSGVDMQTATNASMIGVGVSWGFRPVEELAANNAEVIIDQPKELIDYVFSSA